MKLYKSAISHDKHITRRYNDKRDSTYMYIIAGQLADKIISLKEIDKFSEDTKSRLILLRRINEPDYK